MPIVQKMSYATQSNRMKANRIHHGMVAVAIDRLDDEGDHRPIAADSAVAREAAATNALPDSVTDRPDFAARTARVDDYLSITA
jgi:hypothetical protein